MLRIALVLCLVACDRESSKEDVQLPKFSERVHLEVTATWAAGPGNCIDAVTTTNLPPGTTFFLSGQQRLKPDGVTDVNRIIRAGHKIPVLVSTPRQEHKGIFCEKERAPIPIREAGMLLEVGVTGPDSRLLTFRGVLDEQVQRTTLGAKGEKLQGPLARRIDDMVIAKSPTFVLEGSTPSPQEPQ